MLNAHSKLVDTHEESMNRYQCNVAAEEHEKLLITLANTIVDPWAGKIYEIELISNVNVLHNRAR